MKSSKSQNDADDYPSVAVKEHRKSSADKLTPFFFDEFVPYMCLLWQSPVTVTVTRMYQEEYVKATHRRPSSKTSKNTRFKHDNTSSNKLIGTVSKQVTTDVGEAVPIRACYNNLQKLVEVAIIGSPSSINRVIIQVLSMTLPYHPMLSKLVICKGNLTATALYEVAKLLPQSFLTEICLDDTRVPELNYPALLKASSKLKILSLNRCDLKDECCKEIAASIETGTPGGTLRTLELSSNTISDEGALAIADVLRRNRQLLHLNLSGNLITDKGALAILSSLMEFPMRYDEILNMKTERLEYNRRKMTLYNQYVAEVIAEKQRTETRGGRSNSRTTRTNRSMRSATPKPKAAAASKKLKKVPTSDNLPSELAATGRPVYNYPELEQKAREEVGEFLDTFDAYHVLLRDRYFYCVGNMYLCSLNLAYNNMEYASVKKIWAVLKYQSELNKPPGTTGLLRLTFEGNYVPETCEEYVDIEMFLQVSISRQMSKSPSANKKKNPSATTRRSVFK